MDAILNEEVKLVSLTGKAGTGKTLIALAGALKKKSNYRQILMARPIVALSNKDIGYLHDWKSFEYKIVDNLEQHRQPQEGKSAPTERFIFGYPEISSP